MRLPCDLIFGCRPGEDIAGEDYVTDLRQKMDDIHELVRSHLQIASDRMKERYDIRAGEGGYKDGDLVWLYNPQRRRGLSPKLQKAWEGPFVIRKKINDIIYRISKTPNGKPRVVHFNRLAPFEGDHDQHARGVRVPEEDELSFEAFMGAYSASGKARFGVTKEQHQDLLLLPEEYSLASCISSQLGRPAGLADVIQRRFGHCAILRSRVPAPGEVLGVEDGNRFVFYLVTRGPTDQPADYRMLWEVLHRLREEVLAKNIQKLAMPKLECRRGHLDWRIVRSMVEVVFENTGVEILVCSFSTRNQESEGKTVACYFNGTSRCKKGSSCRYRHDEPRTFQEERV